MDFGFNAPALKKETNASVEDNGTGSLVIPLLDPSAEELRDSSATLSIIDRIKKSYIGPRIMLATSSILYATNYPLMALMNNSLPPSFTTMVRMTLAAIPLLPFLVRMERKLIPAAIFSGLFDAMAHITLSLALVHTNPPRASFLGSLTVIMCPILEAIFDRKDISIQSAPQVWLAAMLSLAGVALLELYGSNDETEQLSNSNEALGDGLAVLSASCMSACFYTTERILRNCTGKVLPLTAVQVGVAAIVSMIWCSLDRWAGKSWNGPYGLPSSLFQTSMLPVTMSILWTGLISTDLNFLLETTSLERVSSSEAAVILATEPLWVVLFSFILFKDGFNADDCIGGILVVAACLTAALDKNSIRRCASNREDQSGQQGDEEALDS